MADREGLVAILGLVTFMAILIAWNFVTSSWVRLTKEMGQPVGVPGSLDALMFLVAIAAGIIVFLKFNS
ncbi:hypothetical protein [Halorussus sp. AFM4]|uniref:hypothetical protein n=1 Tax=Halorussus sp. AFM4 TaxID=3421651 RepID=UPI003EBBEED9